MFCMVTVTFPWGYVPVPIELITVLLTIQYIRNALLFREKGHDFSYGAAFSYLHRDSWDCTLLSFWVANVYLVCRAAMLMISYKYHIHSKEKHLLQHFIFKDLSPN